MKKLFLVSTVFIVSIAGLYALPLKLAEPGQKKDCNAVSPLSVDDYASWTTIDRDGDGKIDYAIKYTKNGKMMEQEALDYNNDGMMDDFLIYQDGYLVRREVDSNYDGKIDLWAYMEKGMYLLGYEKDEDFDGVIDKVKKYDKAEKKK